MERERKTVQESERLRKGEKEREREKGTERGSVLSTTDNRDQPELHRERQQAVTMVMVWTYSRPP